MASEVAEAHVCSPGLEDALRGHCLLHLSVIQLIFLRASSRFVSVLF